MLDTLQIFIILLAALLIGVADALIKKVSATQSFWLALRDPWMLVICLLYLLQITMVVYVFVQKGSLAVYGSIFIIFFSIATVLLGVLAFKEHLSYVQIIGIVLGLLGAYLINR